jgi:hypothetical protein
MHLHNRVIIRGDRIIQLGEFSDHRNMTRSRQQNRASNRIWCFDELLIKCKIILEISIDHWLFHRISRRVRFRAARVHMSIRSSLTVKLVGLCLEISDNDRVSKSSETCRTWMSLLGKTNRLNKSSNRHAYVYTQVDLYLHQHHTVSGEKECIRSWSRLKWRVTGRQQEYSAGHYE